MSAARYRTEVAAFAFLGVAIACSIAFGVWAALVRTQPYDPITFAPQTVERVTDDGVIVVPLIDGFNGPAVSIGETVPVHAELTVDSSGPVEVVGSVTWLSVEPPGIECVEVDEVPRLLPPGVSAFSFENDIPDCVTDAMADGVARRWRITGTSTPTAPGGVTSIWSTEAFWLVP